jgi:hypothetical protein
MGFAMFVAGVILFMVGVNFWLKWQDKRQRARFAARQTTGAVGTKSRVG